MQNNTENDIDQHITTLLTDILAPTNYAELKGVLKTVDLLTDYVRLENVRTILEDDVLFRENRDVAVMALDILRKMHDNEQDPGYDACEAEVVDTVNEALGRAEPETIPLIENVDDVGEMVAVAEPETTPEPAEVEATTVDATETQPEQVSHETPKIDTVIEIPVSSYAVSEDSEVTGTNGDSADPIDSQTTELEPEPDPVADGSGFPGLPDDEGLSDSADPMEGGAPELESESTSPEDSPGLLKDSEVTDTGGDSVDSIDSPTTEPEPIVDGSGFPGLPDDDADDDRLSDSADPLDGEAPGLESEPTSDSADFPELPIDSKVTDTDGDSVDSIDILTTEPEPVADGSGFPGLPDDDGLSDSADPMEGGAPELAPAPADFPGLPEDSNIPDTVEDSADPIDSQTTEPEPVADGSGFSGLPDDGGLSDPADSMEGEIPEPEPVSTGADFPELPIDSEVTDTDGDSVDSIDILTTELEPEPEPIVDGSGFPGLTDDDADDADDGLSDSADPVDDVVLGLESESASPVDFPGLPEDSGISAPADMADSPFDDDPDQMPAFPDDGDMSGLPEPTENKAGGELEHQWKQTVQRIKELKTRYVKK